MPQINTIGVVLKCHDLGEKDRIIVLLTADGQKLRVVAKGAKRPGGRFAAAASPLCELSASLHLGRGLHTLNQVEVVTSHRRLREQLDRLAFALFMAELIDLATVEAGDQAGFHQLLTASLQQMEEVTRPDSLLLQFEVRLLDLLGLLPAWDQCASCQSVDRPLVALSAVAGGLVCSRCSNQPGVLALPASAVQLLGYLSSESGEDYARDPLQPGEGVLTKALEQLLFYQLEARPRSYEFLNSLRVVQQ